MMEHRDLFDEEVRKVRVLVCGDSGVGKNRLIDKFTSVGEKKTSTLSTIGILYRAVL